MKHILFLSFFPLLLASCGSQDTQQQVAHNSATAADASINNVGQLVEVLEKMTDQYCALESESYDMHLDSVCWGRAYTEGVSRQLFLRLQRVTVVWDLFLNSAGHNPINNIYIFRNVDFCNCTPGTVGLCPFVRDRVTPLGEFTVDEQRIVLASIQGEVLKAMTVIENGYAKFTDWKGERDQQIRDSLAKQEIAREITKQSLLKSLDEK